MGYGVECHIVYGPVTVWNVGYCVELLTVRASGVHGSFNWNWNERVYLLCSRCAINIAFHH